MLARPLRPSAHATSSASRTGRRSRRTRSSSARARDGVRRDRRLRASPAPAAPERELHLYRLCADHPGAARPARALLRRRRADRAGRRPRGRSTSTSAAGDRRGGGRRVPCSLRSGTRRTSGRGRGAAATTARSPRSSPPTRSRRSSASTSGASTTAIDAYLGPVAAPATSSALATRAPRRGCPSRSSCARRAASRRSPRLRRIPPSRCVSGPAAGAVGAALAARAAGVRDAISLDMGGTSTDVRLITDGGGGAGVRAERRRASGPAADASTCTPSAPAAARSSGVDAGGALRVGPRERGRRSRPGLLRARRHAADRDRREPRCWAGCRDTLAGGSSSTARRPSVRSARSTRPRSSMS